MISGEAGRSTWIRLECADYTYIDLSHYISIIYIYFRYKKILQNDQRSRDAAAQNRALAHFLLFHMVSVWTAVILHSDVMAL